MKNTNDMNVIIYIENNNMQENTQIERDERKMKSIISTQVQERKSHTNNSTRYIYVRKQSIFNE